jgi:hypothetical protein
MTLTEPARREVFRAPSALYAHKPWPNGQCATQGDENHATAVESQLNPGKIQNN